MNELLRTVKPVTTSLEAGKAMMQLLEHVHRVIFVPDDRAIREAMVLDGAEEGRCDFFTYSWIVALMPELDLNEEERVLTIEFDEIGHSSTVVLRPQCMNGPERFRYAMQLPPEFYRLDQEARFVSVTPHRQNGGGSVVEIDGLSNYPTPEGLV